ncbi:S8 family serine peptidase [Prosthecobacter sp. SYSU 5D2]|uniref:S8 family serine peptidase n=1 Tax=Prosthecobacter sp. SYSU 5D2 TaxID=3134134 RepID=UPI0031FE8087
MNFRRASLWLLFLLAVAVAFILNWKSNHGDGGAFVPRIDQADTLAPKNDAPRPPPTEVDARTALLLRTKSGENDVAEKRVIIRSSPMMSAEEAAFLKSLKPRVIPPKEPLHVPEGQDLKLTVKLADPLIARADQNGRLLLHAKESKSLNGLTELADSHRLNFHRLHTASDEQIAALTRRAAEMTGEAQADLAAMIEVKLPLPTRQKVVSLAQDFHAMDEVEWVELEAMDLLPPPPAEDIAPPTPLLVSHQRYRWADIGVDIDHVWNEYGIRGDARIRISDCEYDLNMDHEDLSGLVKMQPEVVSRYTGFGMGHGTSVLGIMASGDNGYGTSGGAPDCDYWFYPEYSTLTTGAQYRAACVLAAIVASGPGDIVVLEMQTGGPGPDSDYVPAEYNQSVWTSVRTGTNAGVLTIAAAGNGNQNLDDAMFDPYHARGDSGAIIVGAGDQYRVKRSFSTYGRRVDMQAWGGSVFTTSSSSSGTYVYGADPRQSYTAGFSGTSSATPIVVSAAALLQAVALNISEVQLSPGEIRQILKETGQEQAGDTSTAIGPLPDLKAATALLFEQYPPDLDDLPIWGYYYLAASAPDLTADSDGDGLANMLEYLFGTDPSQDLSEDEVRKPHLSTVTTPENGTTTLLEFHQPAVRTDVSWMIEKSTTLLPDSWQEVVHETDGATIIRNGDRIIATLPPEMAADRTFLRVKAWLTSPALE